jgi:hypothetical protein
VLFSNATPQPHSNGWSHSTAKESDHRDILAIDLRLPDRVAVVVGWPRRRASTPPRRSRKEGRQRMSASRSASPRRWLLPPNRSVLVAALDGHQQDRVPDRPPAAPAADALRLRSHSVDVIDLATRSRAA